MQYLCTKNKIHATKKEFLHFFLNQFFKPHFCLFVFVKLANSSHNVVRNEDPDVLNERARVDEQFSSATESCISGGIMNSPRIGNQQSDQIILRGLRKVYNKATFSWWPPKFLTKPITTVNSC